MKIVVFSLQWITEIWGQGQETRKRKSKRFSG